MQTLVTLFPHPPPPPGIKTGKLKSQSAFKGNGVKVAETLHTERLDTYVNSPDLIVKAYYASDGSTSSPTRIYKIHTIGTRPFRLASLENFKDGLSTITDFTYRSDKEHLLPIETETTHPDGTVEKKEIKYAKELNQVDLLNRHIIHTPLENQSFTNTALTGGQKTQYTLFAGFPRPQTVQSYNTLLNTWETEATFNSYDSHGNPSSVTLRGWQPETYTWDKDLLTQKSYLAFDWQYEYETNTSLLKKYTEPNGLFTTYSYDGLSRLASVNQYNNKAITTLGYTYGSTNTISIATDYLTGADLLTEKIMDGLGRSKRVRKIAYGQGGQNVVSQTNYDAAGRIQREWVPGFASASSANTTYTYEDLPLARPVSMVRPAPLGVETVSYGNNNHTYTETLTNALGEYTQSFTDTRGRKVKTISGKAALTNTTRYIYDDRNNLLKVLPDGRMATDVDYIYAYNYDGRNRLLSKKIPEKAMVFMGYNLRNLVTHHKDGLHPVVYTEYDAYGRNIKTGTVASLNSSTILDIVSETEFKTAGLGFGQAFKNKFALFGSNGLPNGDFINTEITSFDAFHRASTHVAIIFLI